MYKTKNLFFFLAVLLFSTGSLFAQSVGSATTNVKIQLKKGLSITNVTGSDLVFNETVIGTVDQDIPSSGQIRFLVSGQNGATIDVNYPTTVNLDDGASNSLTFTSIFEQTGETTTYTSGSTVSSAPLTLGTNGFLNLWLSGSINVPSTAIAGSYTGLFTVDVAYN